MSSDTHAPSPVDPPPHLLPLPTALGIGALAVVSFHLAYEFPPLAFLIGVFVYCLCRLAWVPSARMAFYLGLAIGLAVYGPQLAFFSGVFGLAAVAMWAIAGLWLALFLMLSRSALGLLPKVWAILAIPFIWTGLEYFRSELYYLRFSWLSPGFAFSHVGPMQRLGCYGVGFLLLLIAALLHLLPAKARLGSGTVLLVVLALFTPVPLSTPTAPTANQHRPWVVGIQLESKGERQIVERLDAALAQYPQADLLVLSEYSFFGPVPQEIRNWCQTHHRYLIAGGTAPVSNDPDAFRNTAYVVGPDGQIIFTQGKSVPIQFFSDGLPATEQHLWDSPWGKIGLAICYDLSYSRVIDRLVGMGADALIVPTMDVKSWGAHQHRLHARVAPTRAAEYAIPIVRVCSSGISQIVLPTGLVAADAPYPGQGEMVAGQLLITPGAHRLPPDRLLAPLCVTITALLVPLLLLLRLRRRRLRLCRQAQAHMAMQEDTTAKPSP